MKLEDADAVATMAAIYHKAGKAAGRLGEIANEHIGSPVNGRKMPVFAALLEVDGEFVTLFVDINAAQDLVAAALVNIAEALTFKGVELPPKFVTEPDTRTIEKTDFEKLVNDASAAVKAALDEDDEEPRRARRKQRNAANTIDRAMRREGGWE